MNKKYIKIFIIFIIFALICIVVYLSKQYFNSNYNSHKTAESNLDIYRVKMAQQEEIDKESNTSYVVSQTQPEVHTETTQVVDLTPTPYTPTNSTETPKEQNQIQAEPTKAEKPIEKPKTEPKKPEQNPTVLTKPKTLEPKPNVTQAVLNKSDFQTYVIQVGAFSTKEEAEIMKNRVSQIPAVSKFKVAIEYFPAKNLHKVLVEYFENADSARTTCTELKKANVQCFATKI